jgi:tRNA (guanine37-N1)-methyltransferase
MKPSTLKEALKGKIPKIKLEYVQSAYDRIGDMIIVDVPDELLKYEKLIGEKLLEMHKGIKVVAKKVGRHYGKYRRQKLRLLAGERRKTAQYVESGCRMLVNYEDAYFSPRLSTDRLRIAERVKRGEDVLVMFSGVAPYCIVIRKHSSAGLIYGVEINPKAHELALKNVELNKMKDIKLYCGDVKDVVPKLRKKFDRVHMCLPKNAWDYLDVALKVAKKGGVIDYYAFWHVDEFDVEKKKLMGHVKKLGYDCKVVSVDKCGDHKPREYRVCVEIKVL